MTEATTPLATIAGELAGHGNEDLPLAVAQAALARLATPVAETESVPLAAALGRVLAADLVSPLDVPAHDNSAMDGYSFAGSALRGDGPTQLPVAGTALAGHGFDGPAPAAACIRIMTGAPLPAGHDSVVPQELVSVQDGVLTIPAGAARAGQHCRRRGEDLRRGGVALAAGRRLRPSDLGLAASLGQPTLEVRRRLRVAYFSTGDELTPPGAPLAPGAIYDSNRTTLGALLARLSVDAVDLGSVRDDPQALAAALAAGASCDAIVASGGVSVGDADHTRAVFEAAGEVLFWRLALRPGRPMAIGRMRGGALLFGLPGNPVAAMVCFQVLVREVLLRLAGATPRPLPTLVARAAVALKKRPGRTEFQRGVLRRGPDGQWEVLPTGDQGSGLLSSMSRADGLIVLAHERGPVAAGERVELLPFEALD
ncbi:molybdopterin molybdenumtransferase MoeA [Rubrivivax gelatinosus]|nr:molybdopterin molybdenumtransferase MoeA [Rubrivivax gelatinosus]